MQNPEFVNLRTTHSSALNKFCFLFLFLSQTLSDQAKTYAVDLLDQCRSSEEVIAVLNKDSESDDEFPDEDVNSGKLTLSRLQLALKYEQKQVNKYRMFNGSQLAKI